MKKMIMLLCVLSIQTVLASETSLKCKSPYSADVNAEVFFNDQGLITKIAINGEDGWDFNNNEDDQTIDTNVLKLIPQNNFLASLKNISKVKAGTYNKATLKIVTGKKEGPATTESQLEIISDDGAGIAFLQFSSDKNSNVGNALFAGWGGMYYDCK